MGMIDVTVKRVFMGKDKDYYAELTAPSETPKLGTYKGVIRRFMHLGPDKPKANEIEIGSKYTIDEDDLI